MTNDRSPDEILADFDRAQKIMDDTAGLNSDDPVLRDLLWEVLDAVIEVARQTADQQENEDALAGAVNVTESVTDFLGNKFGDD